MIAYFYKNGLNAVRYSRYWNRKRTLMEKLMKSKKKFIA